jgi:hypothetical protein
MYTLHRDCSLQDWNCWNIMETYCNLMSCSLMDRYWWLVGTAPCIIKCRKWKQCGMYRLNCLYVSTELFVCIDWIVCMYRLNCLYVSTELFVCIDWIVCMYGLNCFMSYCYGNLAVHDSSQLLHSTQYTVTLWQQSVATQYTVYCNFVTAVSCYTVHSIL